MPLNAADLPLLLAGPILRRVESDLVSVWIATSRACNVSLLLFDDGDIVGSSNPANDPRAKWVSAVQPTLQIGANLHVLTVVLDLRNPGGNATRSHGATIDADRIFSYDLQLIERANPTRQHNLKIARPARSPHAARIRPRRIAVVPNVPNGTRFARHRSRLLPATLHGSTARGRSGDG